MQSCSRMKPPTKIYKFSFLNKSLMAIKVILGIWAQISLFSSLGKINHSWSICCSLTNITALIPQFVPWGQQSIRRPSPQSQSQPIPHLRATPRSSMEQLGALPCRGFPRPTSRMPWTGHAALVGPIAQRSSLAGPAMSLTPCSPTPLMPSTATTSKMATLT